MDETTFFFEMNTRDGEVNILSLIFIKRADFWESLATKLTLNDSGGASLLAVGCSIEKQPDSCLVSQESLTISALFCKKEELVSTDLRKITSIAAILCFTFGEGSPLVTFDLRIFNWSAALFFARDSSNDPDIPSA